MAQPTRYTHLFLYFLLLYSSLVSYGQPSSVTQAFDSYRQQSLIEKLFVHTDQNFYLTGETLWFSAYYVDGSFHRPLDVSKVAYVELLDKEGRSIVRTKAGMTAGGGNGSLFLPASLRSGTYLMRAYTNYMKNAGAGYFFEKPLTIVNPFIPLDPPSSDPVAEYDIQLFPEGGHLVQGLMSRVAFKAGDASGHGVTIRGWLLNGQNDTLSRFTSHKFGMGSFDVTPAAGVKYRVLMQDEQGRSFTRPLPAVQPRGYVVRVDDAGAEQLKITVSTNVDAASSVSLFAHTRNAIKVADSKTIEREASFMVDKKALGDGITHLTIFNASQQPVCERLYFKQPLALPITLKTNQPDYAARTPVILDASVQGLTGAGQTNLSIAVYRLDSLSTASSENILSSLWLTSDLPGYVESPAYYLQPETSDVKQAVDNLMLTHGWRRFRWADILGKTSPPHPFIAEVNGPLVQGAITDPTTGAPLPGKITFLSTIGKPIRLSVSTSDAAGRVRFEVRDFYGPKSLVLQTSPPDSLARLSLLNPFSDEPTPHTLPDFSLPEARLDQLLNRSVAMQVQSAYTNDRSVRYAYPVIDSTAFYGKPSESYLLDTYTRFPRMEEVLREYVPGVMPRKRQGRFRLEVVNSPYRAIFDEPALVLIDGVPVFDGDRVIEFSPLKIKQLDVLTNRYFLGRTEFNGIVSFMTYKSDLTGFPLDAHVQKLDYDGLQLQREFYTPRYDLANPQSSRLPDARTLLYWNPALQTSTDGNARISFPTSDQTGTYLIEVNGLTKEGRAGNQRATFRVKNIPK
ncbi:MAG: hypothetical protein H7319_18930 [Spirosoma sp.]|nr:hypothetical protein [Spirosoma sp.]